MISKELAYKMRNDLGISASSILLPKKDVDMTKWSVVACDQYTSEQEYWNGLYEYIGGSPSTLNLIFPEAYLDGKDADGREKRIASIRSHMSKYLEGGIFYELRDSLILTERKFASGKTRCGLMLSVDLDRYDYTPGSQSLIRATEGTILDRLPPRIRIRENAPLELPHIMILIDDRERTVIEPLTRKAGEFDKIYDFDLVEGSGSIKGWKIDDEKYINSVYHSLKNLADPANFKSRYNLSDNRDVLLYAVGDGNHSLATAKACWENLKKILSPGELENHPARYALAEIINLHDSGLVFEPIHRILFNVESDEFLMAFTEFYNQKGCRASICHDIPGNTSGCHVIRYISAESEGFLVVKNPISNIDVATLQVFIDRYLKSNPGVTVDYVHGDEVTMKVGSKAGNMGFFLAPMDKNELFRTVILDGALPRKTFSMGEAAEKRFYLEARKIR